MKSITIKDSTTGQKLIRVYHSKNGYYVESRSDLFAFDCLIICNDRQKINIPVRRDHPPNANKSIP